MAVELAISNKVVLQEHASQAEETARRSIASLYNEVLSQALHDGEAGDNSVEYEVMETADEVSPIELLR